MRVISRYQKCNSAPGSDQQPLEEPLVEWEKVSDEWTGELPQAIQPV